MDTAARLAQSVRRMVEKRVLEWENRKMRTTISIGLSQMIPESDAAKEDIIMLADKGLYLNVAFAVLSFGL